MITRNTDYSIQRLRGLSMDTKPTDVPNGSEFREMDTGKKFLYSAAGTEWIEQPCCGGGSGGGGGNVLIVTLNSSNVADKTFAEISAAIDANSMVFLKYTNNGDTYLQLASYVKGNEIAFSYATVGKDSVVTMTYICSATDEWHQIIRTYPSGN